MSNRKDRAMLATTATALMDELSEQQSGTTLHRVKRLQVVSSDTDGWFCKIASLGRGQPGAEIWLDHYVDHTKRRFWVGYYSPKKDALAKLLKHLPVYLRPNRRRFTVADTEQIRKDVWLLKDPLKQSEFGRTFYERYYNSRFYFGVFDHTNSNRVQDVRRFIKRAATFLVDVARSLPSAKPATYDRTVYPRFENRKIVKLHVYRERDSSLSEECKIRDNYCCRVCKMAFEQIYGLLGREFAEAHHIIPLSRFKGQIERSAADLVTVCANCHRMLHRMEGKQNDLMKLQALVCGRKKYRN
jgi:HNH endonuclease